MLEKIPTKVYVHAFQRVVGVQRAKPLVALARAKYLKLTVKACRKNVITNKSKKRNSQQIGKTKCEKSVS